MKPFLPVSITQDGSNATKNSQSREFIALAIVGAVVLLVFWVRQESISSPVALPMHLSVVGPGKRALAALVDLIPAMAVAMVIWYDPLVPYLQEFAAVSATGDKAALEDFVNGSHYPNLLWAGVTFRLTYTLYCTAFELLLSATPGKRLLGCVILSESLERPNRIQILIRNLTRMVELEPLLKIWPFVLVIFFTRNRQRIGDLLARTIVVEQQSVIDSDLPPDSNESDNDIEV